MNSPASVTASPARLLGNFSAEITAKDADAFEQAASLLPGGTPVSVTYLPGETHGARQATAALVRRFGHVPIPHVSARQLSSAGELDLLLEGLAAQAQLDRVLVVAGDCAPNGPFADALAVIQSGRLAAHGVKRVGISGYPEGHPQIDKATLWRAMRDKHDALRDQGHEVVITTQFAFDAAAVTAWIREVRERGFTSTIRLGVPGPASVRSMLRFAARCGVGTSTKVLRKYGASLTQLMTVAGPDRMLAELAAALDPASLGWRTLRRRRQAADRDGRAALRRVRRAPEAWPAPTRCSAWTIRACAHVEMEKASGITICLDGSHLRF